MPVLVPSEYSATVTWLGHVPAGTGSLRADAVEFLPLDFDGDTGARHFGTERPSCERVSNLYPKGTAIRNVRQLTILSAEELALIAAEMGIDALDAGLIGASVILQGIPDFTHVPPASRLQAPSGLTLTIDMENRPCNLPAKVIDAENPGYGKAFKSAAQNRRGVTAWVERPGSLALGDTLTLFIPDQRAWAPNG